MISLISGARFNSGSSVILEPHGARGWYADALQTTRFKLFQKFETVDQLRVDFEGLKPIGLSLARSGSTLKVNLDPGSTAALFRAPAAS